MTRWLSSFALLTVGGLVAPDAKEPQAFRHRGRVVCLAEEMNRQYNASLQPVHDHVLGFRVDDKTTVGELRYYTLLRTEQSEALFVDKRFHKHTLVLYGRTFPSSGLLEVSGWQWIHDGKLYDVYYWCETCSIRGVDPGDCACCQAPVELREKLLSDVKTP